MKDKKEISNSAFGEIGFTLGISFIPIFIAAALNASNNKENFWKTLYGYFAGGELGLYVLSICGTISWLMFVKTKINKAGPNGWLLVVCIILPVVASSMIIGSNPNFGYNIPALQSVSLLLLYALVIFGWYKSIVAHQSLNQKVIIAQKLLGNKDLAENEQQAIQDVIG